MSSSLSQSVARGTTWLGSSEMFGQGLRLITTVVLARLLLPEDFGILAMAAVITEVVMRIADLGFADAIIQRKDTTSSHLSTCFWTMLGLGIILCGVTVAISPIMAGFFDNELVGPVLAVSSIAFVIAPLRIIHGSLMRKQLNFLRFSIGEVVQAVAYLAAAISMAILGFGVWSLVIGNLTGQVALLISRWTLYRWHPSLTFSIESLKDLWKFGASVTGTRAVQLLIQRLDYLILGRFLSAATLGIYHMAHRIVISSNTGLLMTVNRVAFPAFSLIQSETERLRRGFIRSIAYLSLILLPIFAGLAIVGPELVRVVLGEQWLEAITPMQILCLSGFFLAVNITVGPILRAKGRPGVELVIAIVTACLRIPALLISVQYGIVSVAIAVTSVSVLIFPIRLYFIKRVIGVTMIDYLITLRPAFIGTAIMTIILLPFRYTLTSILAIPDIVLLISSILLGILVYFSVLKIAKVQSLSEMSGLVFDVVRPFARSAKSRIFICRK